MVFVAIIRSIQSYLPLNIAFQRQELIKNPLPDTRTITNIIPIIEPMPPSNQTQKTMLPFNQTQKTIRSSDVRQQMSILDQEKTQQKSQNQQERNQEYQQMPTINNNQEAAQVIPNPNSRSQNNIQTSRDAQFKEEKFNHNQSQCWQDQQEKINSNDEQNSTQRQNIKLIQVQNIQQNIVQKQNQKDQDQFDDISLSIADQDMKELDEEYGVQVPTQQEIYRFINLLHTTCPQFHFQTLLCSLNNYFNYLTSNQTQTQTNSNYNYSDANSTALTTRSVASDFQVSNSSYGYTNSSNKSYVNGYETPSFLNHNHPDYRPSYHSIQSQKYIRRHRSRRDFDSYGYDPKKSPEYRQNLERRIAYVFLTKGYGLGLTRQTLKEDVQNNLYNSLLTSVLRVSLRKLCDLLTNHLKLNIEVFDSKDEIQLRSPMANCRKWMQQKDLATFNKIITQIYNLNKHNQPIYPQQLVNLYNSICKQHLNKKVYFNTNTNSNSRQPIDFGTPNRGNVYNYQKQQFIPSKQSVVQNGFVRITPSSDQVSNKQAYQKELLLQFLKYGNIDRITDMLNLKYRQKNTPESSMIIIEKVIHNGLKNLVSNYLHLRKKMPQIPNLMLNDRIIGVILRDRNNNKFRVTIIKLLNQLRINFNQKIGSVVSYINNYVNSNNLMNSNTLDPQIQATQ